MNARTLRGAPFVEPAVTGRDSRADEKMKRAKMCDRSKRAHRIPMERASCEARFNTPMQAMLASWNSAPANQISIRHERTKQEIANEQEFLHPDSWIKDFSWNETNASQELREAKAQKRAGCGRSAFCVMKSALWLRLWKEGPRDAARTSSPSMHIVSCSAGALLRFQELTVNYLFPTSTYAVHCANHLPCRTLSIKRVLKSRPFTTAWGYGDEERWRGVVGGDLWWAHCAAAPMPLVETTTWQRLAGVTHSQVRNISQCDDAAASTSGVNV